MATISLDTSAGFTVRPLQTNPDANSPLPRAKVEFFSTTTIAALGAGDDLVATGNFSCPSGYGYVLLDARVRVDMPSQGDLSDFERIMSYQFVINGLVRKRGQFPSLTFAAIGQDGQKVRDPANTNDWSNYYGPYQDNKIFNEVMLGGQDGDVVLSTTLTNSSPITAPGVIVQEYVFLQYTLEQAVRARVHMLAKIS